MTARLYIAASSFKLLLFYFFKGGEEEEGGILLRPFCCGFVFTGGSRITIVHIDIGWSLVI